MEKVVDNFRKLQKELTKYLSQPDNIMESMMTTSIHKEYGLGLIDCPSTFNCSDAFMND